jgi:hypothetical protein
MKGTNSGNVWAHAWRLYGISFSIAIPLGLGAMFFDARLIFVLVGFTALMSAFAQWTLRCPSCEKLVVNRVLKFGKTTIEVPWGLPEKVCSRCGKDHTRKARAE